MLTKLLKAGTAVFLVHISSLAMAVTADGVFTCSGGYAQDCSLKKASIPGSEARFADGTSYEADYLVTYNFACDDAEYLTNLEINAGKASSHAGLYYNRSAQTITVTGQGPLQITDSNPAGSREEGFSSCSLSVSETHAPSATQVQSWLTAETNTADAINVRLPMVELIADVSAYYDAYAQDPSGTAGFLRAEIARLTAAGSSGEDHTEAASLQQIIAGTPRAQVLQPLLTAKAELQAAYNQAVTLKAHLTAANQQLNSAFSTAIDQARAALR